MTCLHAPASVTEFRSVVEGCAIAAGGADWRSLFLTGLGTLLLIGLLVVLAVLAWRAL